jgi:Fe-Mn family superoxide dismutase
MEITAVSFTNQPGVVSQKQFDDHITLYKGYVEKTNEITNKLKSEPEYASANATWSHYRGLKKGETYAIDGVIMHELYFQNLSGGSAPMGKKTAYLMERYFGGEENWKNDFVACAKSARGWCVCVYEQRTDSCRNILLDSHDDGQICTAYPLIVLDMYEHAYFLDYGTDKGTYINKFINRIPWEIIEKRANAVVR